jgi:hypothetical protein
MLDDVHDQIRAWLDAEPTLSGVGVLSRLKEADAAKFTDKHLRTVQRAVKLWRRQQARRLIAESAAVIAPRTMPDLAIAPNHTGDNRGAVVVGF